MAGQESSNEVHTEEYSDDSEEAVSGRSYKLLRIEYEKCRQEIHDLKRKLELNDAMLREIQEANESLERSADRRVAEKDKALVEFEEKYRVLAGEYDNAISILQAKLAERANEIEELRQREDRWTKVERDHATEPRPVPDLSLEADNVALRNRVQQLLSAQREERERCERAEEMIEELKNRADHYESYSRSIKEQLDEKERLLEDTRAELALKRAEMASLEVEPAREAPKGNSLFAEVEDRRRNVVSKMNVLREKFTELKRVCKSQIAEIKMLRAERVATLRKWENDAGHAFAENEELIQKYRSRISDLESKLRSEIKKNEDARQPTNTIDASSFGYLQSLLDAKKKETDQLRLKVEDLCTKLLVQEETKLNISKQLQYWRYKASSLEARVCTLQAELKLDLIDDTEDKASNVLDRAAPAFDNDAATEEKRSPTRPTVDNFVPPPSSRYSPKLEGARCSVDDRRRCSSDDRSSSNAGSDANDVPESRRDLATGNTLVLEIDKDIVGGDGMKRVGKQLRFNDDTTMLEYDPAQRQTTEGKYPVLYIPTDFAG